MRTNVRRKARPSPLISAAAFLLTVAPVLALTVCATLYMRQLGRYLSPRLAPLVAQASADTFHREIRIDAISVFDRPGIITVHGLAVSNGPTFASGHGRAFAQIPLATVRYDLPALLKDPANAETAIQTVELTRPSFYVEQLRPGKFNFSAFLKPSNPAKPFPFQGKVFVRDGAFVVRDDNAPKLLGIQQNAFTHVNAAVDLTTPGRVALQGTAAGASNRFASVQLHGDVLDPPAQTPSVVHGFALRVHVAHGNVPYLTDYFAPFLAETLRLQRGVGDADVTISQFGTAKNIPLTIIGNAKVQEGGARFVSRGLLRSPLTSVNARLAFTTTDLAIDGTTVVSGALLSVHGAVLDFAHPHLALSLESPAVTYAGLRDSLAFLPALPAGVSLPKAASAAAWITGDLRRPRVQVSADLPSASFSGTILTALHASAVYQDGILRIDRAQAKEPATNGSLDVRGFVMTQAKPLAYGAAGTLVNVNLAGLPLSAALRRQAGPVAGIASARFQVSSRGIQADVTVVQASVRHILIDDVSGHVDWTAGSAVNVHRFVAHLTDGGVVSADGQIPIGSRNGQWNLSVRAAQIGLGRLVRPLVHVPIGGELYLFGTLHGPGAVPELTGNLTVLVPHYGNYIADQLKGTFSASADGAQIERVVIQRFPGSAVIAGTVTHLASGNPALDLHVTVTGAQLSDLTRLAAQQPVARSAARAIVASATTLTGDLGADLNVAGTVARPHVAGQISLNDATYSIFEIDHALADVAYAGNTLRVSHLTATGTGTTLDGTGSYDLRTHRIAAQISASVTDIARLLPATIPLTPAGPLTATLLVAGTAQAPFATAHVMGQNVSIAAVALDQVSLGAQYRSGMISGIDGGLRVTSGKAEYQVPEFRYDPKTSAFSLSGHMTGETVGHALTLARSARFPDRRVSLALSSFLARIPQGASGEIAFPLVQAQGTLKNPSVHLVLNAKNLVDAGERLDTLDADAHYTNAAFDIASLEARGQPNAYVSASGHIDPNGPVDARLEASGIDLAPLNTFLPLQKTLGGQISDVTILASGQTRAPVLTASVTLERPSYGAFSVDGIDSGQISISNNQIAVNGLQIVKDEKTPSGQTIEHIVSLRGALPFAWEPGAFLTPTFPRDVPLSLQVTVPPQSLSSIPALFPGISLKFPSGTISADIGLGGTLANRQVTGSLLIANGAVQSSLLSTSLRDVNVNISLVGDQVQIKTFTADSTAGGKIEMTGGASLTTGAQTDTTRLVDALISGVRLDLTTKATNFAVNEPKITQFGNAGFRGSVTGTVRITQALRAPLVAGSVTLSNVIGVLPSLAQTSGQAAPIPAVDPHFQLGVTVARGSRLRSSLLDAQTDGALTIAGTLSQPDITGDFSIRQGQFFFPTATFRLVPVGTVHLSYVPPNDPVERINVTARTQISVSDATVAANPAGAGEGPGGYVPSRYSPAAQTSHSYTITVTIQGLLNNPNNLSLNFQSDPPGLTQTQILATLGGQNALAGLTQGNVEQALKTGVSQVFTSFAVPLALQPVEKGIASGLGLEDFSIAFTPNAPVSLTFVKRLTPRIGLTYMQMVNSRSTGAVASTLEPPVYQIKLDYSFTDQFRFSLSTDDQRNTIVGLERVYSF